MSTLSTTSYLVTTLSDATITFATAIGTIIDGSVWPETFQITSTTQIWDQNANTERTMTFDISTVLFNNAQYKPPGPPNGSSGNPSAAPAPSDHSQATTGPSSGYSPTSSLPVITATTVIVMTPSSPQNSKTASEAAGTQEGAVPLSTDTAAVSASDGVSKAALAGAAVACFVLGLITAALIFWAFRSRHLHCRPNRISSSATPIVAGSSDDSSHNGSKYVPMIPVPANPTDKALPLVAESGSHHIQKGPDTTGSLAAFQTGAPPYPPSSFPIKRKRISAASASALTDKSVDMSDRSLSELRTQVKTLFEQIEMHVDNFYTEASGLPLTDDYRHNLLQVDSPHLPDSIIGLLPEVTGDQIKPLIKHCLAYAIFSRIGGCSSYTNDEDTLLPSGLTAVTHAIQPASASRAYKSETYQQEMDRRYSWKHETIAMMDTHGIVKSTNIQIKINKLAWKCVKGVEPWALARYGTEAKKSHLMRTMEEAVELGLRLFGEKKGWLVWQWEQNPIDAHEGTGLGDFVLFPGLELRKELGNGKAGSRADGESDRNVVGNGSSRAEVVLAPTMASI